MHKDGNSPVQQLRHLIGRSIRQVKPVESRAAIIQERDELRGKVRKLRQRLRDVQGQLDDARAAPDPTAVLPDGRKIDDLQYVFIVAYGRSGSTLLQGVLNSIPGYDIHGENKASAYRLYQYHSGLDFERQRNTRARTLTPQSSWYGIDRFDRDRALIDLRHSFVRTVLVPKSSARVVGFKEIRWFQRDWEDHFAFLQELFPGARFIMNTRDHQAVARSKWWVNANDPFAQLDRYERQFDTLAERFGPAAFRVHYDDYVNDAERLRPLFDWLEEPFDAAAIENVFQKKHSY